MLYRYSVLLIAAVLCSTCFAAFAHADIIKLKRGISFEGKIIDEDEEQYTVELSVGTVSFKKTEVDSVEYVSEMQNDQMFKDWNMSGKEIIEEEPRDILGDQKEMSVPSDDPETSPIEAKPPAEKRKEDMVRYKGRYITPEVYNIIKREKEVQKRRYRFLKQQREKAQSKDAQNSTSQSSSSTPSRDEETEKRQSLGASKSVFGSTPGTRANKKKSLFESDRFKPYEETTKDYGSEREMLDTM